MTVSVEDILLGYGVISALVITPITAFVGQLGIALIMLGTGLFATILHFVL